MARTIRRRVLGVQIEAHSVVFPAGAGLIVAFVVATALFPRRALMLFNAVKASIAGSFSWLYVFSMTGFLIFALWLAFSRFGSIKLGADDEEPEFPRSAWFAMLFSAGMGIGMLFFGVAEPMSHLMAPPGGEAATGAAARQSMAITFFHWCFHPWALYSVVGLGLAYFGFRRGMPLSFRSALSPLLGKRASGWPGHIVDTLAVLATLFGLATSLGLGAKQVNAGLHHVFGLPQGTAVQMLLIAAITSMAVASLVSGLHAGIRRLSELNMLLAFLLLVFLFAFGPTRYLFGALAENIGAYLADLPQRSFWTAAYADESSRAWFNGWTVFYWGWWIAWAPFVGMFIARISRGRTVREFIGGVLLVPSAVAAVWMTGFGNSAMYQEIGTNVAGAESAHAIAHETQPWDVLVTDEDNGLALTEDGRSVAMDAVGVASPHPVLVREKDSTLVSSTRGVPVGYEHGVLVNEHTGDPYEPVKQERYRGPLRAQERQLSLGQYLDSKVLTEDHTKLKDTTATALFVMLEAYPLGWLTAIVATLSVILFFVTSSDSASLVADIIASGGSENPTVGTRLFWGILEGALAAVLLMAGGLVALQTGAIALGLPFCVIIILMCVSLVRGLAGDPARRRRA